MSFAYREVIEVRLDSYSHPFKQHIYPLIKLLSTFPRTLHKNKQRPYLSNPCKSYVWYLSRLTKTASPHSSKSVKYENAIVKGS